MFIDRVFETVNYTNRQRYLHRYQKHQPTCVPPLFKCLPPPHYKLLKQFVLQDYAQLHFISPRFIALRHPTLQSMLVRAKLNPTDEQLIDISLTIEPPSDAHIENAKLPNLSCNQPLITACKHSHCVTCRHHLLRTTTFQSTHPRNRTTYRIRHSLTCTSRNIIYLITCTKQYVGCTTQQLNTRINHHRTNIVNKIRTHVSTHFSQPGHILNQHLKVQPIDSATNSEHTIKELYRLECFWIRTLRRLTSHGLNITPGNAHI